ncbi:hypothetical protein ACH4F6_22335 [Streptomyces sp. NPDC017936]|uniref:hypothetical protein n=1 Tax=Streptomyces sp. NPDC017936 TaxID=3365016 RepID=UPI0037AD1282
MTDNAPAAVHVPGGVVRRWAGALLVNLVIGIPAVVAAACARWYAEHGHCGDEDLRRRDLDGCTYDQIENSGFVLFGLVLFGALVLWLVLLLDVRRPLAEGRPLAPRLWTLPAVLLPYALLTAAAAAG